MKLIKILFNTRLYIYFFFYVFSTFFSTLCHSLFCQGYNYEFVGFVNFTFFLPYVFLPFVCLHFVFLRYFFLCYVSPPKFKPEYERAKVTINSKCCIFHTLYTKSRKKIYQILQVCSLNKIKYDYSTIFHVFHNFP